MSKRRISLLLLLSSGCIVALGCSLFGPLRVNVNDLLAGLGLGS